MPTTWNDSRNCSPSTSTVSVWCSAMRISSSDARVDGVAAHPRARRVRALAVEAGLGDEHALAPGLDPAVGGLEQHREVGGEQLGLRAHDDAEAVELVAHLFGLVEHEGHVVVSHAIAIGVQLLGEAQQHREAALHVGRAEAVQHVALDPRHLVARVGGHGVEVTTEQTRRSRPSCVRTTMLCSMRSMASDGARVAQARLDEVGELGLVVALRRHRHQRGGEPEQVGGVGVEHRRRRRRLASRRGAVVAQDVVELRLVVALALGEALHHQHARQAERATRRTRGRGWRRWRRTSRARCRATARRRSRRRSPGWSR